MEQVHVPPLPLQNRRRTTMGKVLRKASRPQEAVHRLKGSRSCAKITSKELAQIHGVNHGILPCAKITNHKKAASLARSVRSFTRSWIISRIKEERRVKEKGQQLGCVFQDVEPPEVKIDFTEGHNKILGIPTACSTYARSSTFDQTFRKENHHSGWFDRTDPHERRRCLDRGR